MKTKQTTFKHKLLLISVIAVTLTLTSMLFIPISVYAEENTQLSITDEIAENGETTTMVKNIENFLKAPNFFRTNTLVEDRINQVLVALKFTEEEITNMPKAEKMEFLSATSACINTKTMEFIQETNAPYSEGNSVEDEGYYTKYKITYSLRVVNKGNAPLPGHSFYRVYGSAKYDANADKFVDLPIFRGKDFLGMSWTAPAAYGNDYNAYLFCNTFYFLSGKPLGSRNWTVDNKIVTIIPTPSYGFALKIDLPGNTLSELYSNFHATVNTDIVATGTFLVRFLYCHTPDAITNVGNNMIIDQSGNISTVKGVGETDLLQIFVNF